MYTSGGGDGDGEGVGGDVGGKGYGAVVLGEVEEDVVAAQPTGT